MDAERWFLVAKPTIYDLLAKQGIDEITIAQLNTATSNSAVDEASIEFWKGPIVLQRVLQMRTYPHGLPVPELGAVRSQPADPGGTTSFIPSGTEEWKIMGISITAAGGTPPVSVFLTDGLTTVLMHSGATSTTESNFMPLETPFIITASLYLLILNDDLSNAISTKVAYHTVGL